MLPSQNSVHINFDTLLFKLAEKTKELVEGDLLHEPDGITSILAKPFSDSNIHSFIVNVKSRNLAST